MAKADLLRARDALDALVRKSDTRESEVSAVVFEILQAAGYAQGQQEARLPETSMRLDATFEARIEDKTERVGVEVRGMRGNVSGQTVYRAQDLVRKDLLDRVLIVSGPAHTEFQQLLVITNFCRHGLTGPPGQNQLSIRVGA